MRLRYEISNRASDETPPHSPTGKEEEKKDCSAVVRPVSPVREDVAKKHEPKKPMVLTVRSKAALAKATDYSDAYDSGLVEDMMQEIYSGEEEEN